MPEYKNPKPTVDAIIAGEQGRIVLIRRKNPPFKGAYALPGGFVEIGETLDAACRREVLEEAGIELGDLRLVGVYSDPGRDPRGHTVSVAFSAVLPRALTPQAGSDAEGAEWVADWRKLALAFDHAKILEDAEALRGS